MGCMFFWQRHTWEPWRETGRGDVMTKVPGLDDDYRLTGTVIHQERKCRICGRIEVTYSKASL